MIVAFVSGSLKTGRSTIAANLANYLRKTTSVTLLDSDIEQVERAVLLPPEWSAGSEITVLFPSHDLSKCQHCLQCTTICEAGVFKDYKEKIILLPELCNNCGKCLEYCKSQAVKFTEYTVGRIQEAKLDNLTVIEVRVNDEIVKASSLFYHTKDYLNPLDVILVDAAPLISEYACCSTMGADYFVIVTGSGESHLAQLKETIKVFKDYEKPYGVLVNLSDSEVSPTAEYCRENDIPLLGVLPLDEKLQTGKTPCDKLADEPEWQKLFESLWHRILEEIAQ